MVGCAIVMSVLSCQASTQLENIADSVTDKICYDFDKVLTNDEICEEIVSEVYNAHETRNNNNLNTITDQVNEVIKMCNSQIRLGNRMQDLSDEYIEEIDGNLNSTQVAEILQKLNYQYEN